MPLKSKAKKFVTAAYSMFKKQKTNSMDDDDIYQPPLQFPDTLQGFGYHFKNGELCNIESGEKFQFVVKENDHHYNQLHYEALGKVIEEYVYELLETECGLHRLPVPADAYIRDLSSRKTTNQTDDAKAASSSVEGGMTSTARGQEVSNREDVSSPLQNSTDQSDASASAVRVDNSDGNEDSSKISADSSSVGAGVLTENSREETVNESPDTQMEDSEACGELDPSEWKYTNRCGFVFASEGWSEQEKLMVLIHGSGVVRAGQWARRLIINDNLNTGTQIPFIKEAVSLGYGVIVMNTNQNFVVNKNGFSLSIPGSESPVAHACHVWQHYVIPSSASYVAVVAHSYGGVVVTHLFQEYMEHFRDKVFAVAFTDSVHNSRLPRSFTYFRKICRNWVTSMQPLDTPLPNRIPGDVRLLSAGVNSHEMTSAASMKSIFKFFEERLEKGCPMDIDEPSQAEQDAPQNEESVQVDDEINLSDEDKHEGPRETSFNDENNSPEIQSSGVEGDDVLVAEDCSSKKETRGAEDNVTE